MNEAQIDALERGPTDGYSMTQSLMTDDLTNDDVWSLLGAVMWEDGDSHSVEIDAYQRRALDAALRELCRHRGIDIEAEHKAALDALEYWSPSESVLYEIHPRLDIAATLERWGDACALPQRAIKILANSGVDAMTESALMCAGVEYGTLRTLVDWGVFVKTDLEDQEPPPALAVVTGGVPA